MHKVPSKKQAPFLHTQHPIPTFIIKVCNLFLYLKIKILLFIMPRMLLLHCTDLLDLSRWAVMWCSPITSALWCYRFLGSRLGALIFIKLDGSEHKITSTVLPKAPWCFSSLRLVSWGQFPQPYWCAEMWLEGSTTASGWETPAWDTFELG